MRQDVDVSEVTLRDIAALMVPPGRTDRTKFRAQVLRPQLGAGLLAMTIPDKSTSTR